MATWRGAWFGLAGVVALTAACGGAEPAPAPSPRAERVGPGWRLRGAELECLGAGVRVVMPTGWRPMAPGHALSVMPDGVALTPDDQRDPAVYLRISGRPIGTARPVLAQAALAGADLDGEPPIGPPSTAVIGGQRFTVLRTVAEDQVHDHASAIVDGRYVALTLVTPRARADAARPQFEALLAGTVFLDAAARDALTADLATWPSLQDEWGRDYADHGERFRDFVGRWTWRHPPGVWQVAGLYPGPDDPERLRAFEVGTGTSVWVSREPWTAPVEVYLDDYAGAQDQVVAAGAATLAGHPGRYIDIVAPGWMGLKSRTTAAVIDGHVVALQVTNLAPAWPGEAVATAAAAALELAPAMVEVDAGPPYRNWRFGVVVDLPRSFVHEPAKVADTVLSERWRQGSTVVGLAVYSLDSKRGAIADPVERYLASWPVLRRLGPPSRSRVTVDGWRAVRAAWRAPDAVIEATLVERIDAVVELTVRGDAQTGVRTVGADALRFLR